MSAPSVNDIIDKILEYRDMGISAIPVRSGPWYDDDKNVIGIKCKFPAVGGYQELCSRLPTDKEIEKWRWIGLQLEKYRENQVKKNAFKFDKEDDHDLATKGFIRFSGVGLMMGEQSNLMAVDVDETDEYVLNEVKNHLQFSPWTRKGGKGEVRFFIKDEAMPPYLGVGNVEFFSDNRMIVIPPSMYSFRFDTNEVKNYEWTGNGDFDDIPVFEQTVVNRIEMVYEGRNSKFIEKNMPNNVVTDKDESSRFEPLKKYISSLIGQKIPVDQAIKRIIEFDKGLYKSALAEPKWRGNLSKDLVASAFGLYSEIWLSHQKKKRGQERIETPDFSINANEIFAWTEEPIFDETTDEEVLQPMDAMIIPPIWRKLAVNVSEANCLPLESVFLMMLTQLGSILGNKVLIQAKKNNKSWLEAHNIWSVYVSRSGTRKSQLLNTVSHPIHTLQKIHDGEYAKIKEEFVKERDISETQIKVLEKRIKTMIEKQPDSPEIEQSQAKIIELEKKINEPIRKQLVVKGVTPEKLIDIIAKNETGTFLVYNELSELTNMFKKKGYESMRTLLLDAWDGVNPMSYQTKHSGEVFIERACVALYASVQPSMLKSDIRKLASGYGDDGFYQRAFFVFNENPDMEAIDIEFDHGSYHHEYFVYNKAFHLDKVEIPVKLDNLAYDEFIEFETRILKMIEKEPNEAICSFYSKMVGKVVKIASMLEFVSNEGDLHKRISIKSMVDAVYLMERQMYHINKMFDQDKKKLIMDCIQDIREGIIESGQTLNQLERRHGKFFKNEKTRHIIIEELVKRNIAKLTKSKKGYKLIISPRVI